MQSYPLGKSNFATSVTSASLAERASFLSARVNTASIALNYTGPTGPSGSSYTKVGPTGPRGATGPSGSRGLGVYLLSSSRARCCNEWNASGAWFYWGATNASSTNCSADYTINLGTTLHTTCSVTPSTNCKIYTNNTCFSIVPYSRISDGQNYWVLDAGIIQSTGTCTGEI